jgi:sugar phosphate isomerase/epimerase
MKTRSRRQFLKQAAMLFAGSFVPVSGVKAAHGAHIRVGTCTMGLLQAKQAGFDGVEVSAGGEADELDIFKAATRQRYHAQMNETGLPITSIMMGLFNQCPLATDPRAITWIKQSIDAAKDLKAKNILLAFFGKGDLLAGTQLKEEAFTAAAQRIQAVAPYARDAGITLAIENYLSAEQNLRLLERINDESVRIYYDVYNTGKTKRYDSPAEIRTLGARIAQVHYKNGPNYLDEDKAYFEAVSAALRSIAYPGWITLETSTPSKNPVEDGARNAAFVRTLFA